MHISNSVFTRIYVGQGNEGLQIDDGADSLLSGTFSKRGRSFTEASKATTLPVIQVVYYVQYRTLQRRE